MKIALVGCGFFAINQLHAWNDIAGVEVVAICDKDPSRLAVAAELTPTARRFLRVEEMFSCGGFDTVDIVTTVSSHKFLVEMAASHNVNVICQKPFALNLDDARSMVAAMNRSGKQLMVHENFRWQSAIRTVIDEIRSGSIGEPFFGRVSFRSGYDVYAGQPYLAEADRFIIEDLGIHILDITRALFGDVKRITATTSKINPSIKGEDVATMLLAHDSGVTSVVDCSYATKRVPETFPESLIEIDGDKGTLKLDQGYRLSIHVGDKVTVRDLSPQVLPWASRPWHNIQESVFFIQKHFVECIESKTEPETTGEDNLKTFALVEAAYLSARCHETIELNSL